VRWTCWTTLRQRALNSEGVSCLAEGGSTGRKEGGRTVGCGSEAAGGKEASAATGDLAFGITFVDLFERFKSGGVPVPPGGCKWSWEEGFLVDAVAAPGSFEFGFDPPDRAPDINAAFAVWGFGILRLLNLQIGCSNVA
jgi:hypothetical protein